MAGAHCMYVCMYCIVCMHVPCTGTFHCEVHYMDMDMDMDQMHHSCTFCTSCNSTSHLGPVYALFGPELHSISCTVISRPVPPKPAKACMLTLGAQLNFSSHTHTHTMVLELSVTFLFMVRMCNKLTHIRICYCILILLILLILLIYFLIPD